MSVDCVGQLGFHRPLTSLVKESLVVRNPNNRPVAFKIKTTAPKQYCVRPNSGRIEPGQEIEVQVLLQAMKEDPPADFKCRDKFLVQSTIISAEHESSSISVLWSAIEAKNRNDIHEKKIRCVFLPADGSVVNHDIGHDSYDGANSTTAYHVAETSNSDTHVRETPAISHSTAQASEIFKMEPALTSPHVNSPQSSVGLDVQLKQANTKIEQLQAELKSIQAGSRRTDVKTAAVHNEGVPVPMTAMIALIAFLAAYLLF